ncbi:Trehalose/maltose transport system permease protein MalF [Hyphomicrobiales bacterium]|nr:Trehalose/maltose transport system permease protein MalF [Hyphomicrobiales bacterium]CAH1694994.1 Trehalose/maltose transport system permease protein MalF [Hyphomicrobiales bacterium]
MAVKGEYPSPAFACSSAGPQKSAWRLSREGLVRGRWVAPREPQPFLFFVLNTPAILLLLAFVLYPIIYSFLLSLHQYNLRQPARFRFIGLDNYISILGSEQFWRAAQTTALFSLGSIMLTIVLGTLLALLLNEVFPGRALLRAIILIPWAVPPVVNGLIWQWLLDGRYGLINAVLVGAGVLDDYRSWLTDVNTAMPALIVAQAWNHIPFVSLVILAALQTIPDELYEAARMDGANMLQRFKAITLPWLSHSLLLVLITQTMVALRTFDIIYVLTGGGPGDSTTVLAWLTYVTTFNFADFGRGNAYAYLIALTTLALSIVYIRLLWKRGELAR